MKQLRDSGETGKTVELDRRRATQRVDEGGEAFDLPAETSMVHGAMFVFLHALNEDVETLDLSAVTHAGADALVEENHFRASRLLEVLVWPVAEQATARFLFDAEDGLLHRIEVEDGVSGERTTIDLSDYREAAGGIRAHVIDVRARGGSHRDRFSDWEVVP
jgi:hypothetical protein